MNAKVLKLEQDGVWGRVMLGGGKSAGSGDLQNLRVGEPSLPGPSERGHSLSRPKKLRMMGQTPNKDI